MEFGIALGIPGWIVLIVGAVVFGVAVQFIGEPGTGLEWLVGGVAAFVGALVASEFILALREMAPVFDGLALVPALIGGLVVGLVVDVATRYVTGGTFVGRPVSA